MKKLSSLLAMTIASRLDSTAQQLARIEDVFLVNVLVQGECAQARRVGNFGQQALFEGLGEEVHASTGLQFKAQPLEAFQIENGILILHKVERSNLADRIGENPDLQLLADGLPPAKSSQIQNPRKYLKNS